MRPSFLSTHQPLQKKSSFPLRISSVNVTKSAVPSDLVTFTEKILDGELHFFVLRTSVMADICFLKQLNLGKSSKIAIEQLHRKLWIWSHFLKKSLMENFIFCAGNLPCNNTHRVTKSGEILTHFGFKKLAPLKTIEIDLSVILSNLYCDLCVNQTFSLLKGWSL